MMLDPSFFQMDSTCIGYWHSVVDNLMTHDKTTYKDLMCKLLYQIVLAVRIASFKNMGCTLQNVSFGICNQRRPRSAYTSARSDQGIPCLPTESLESTEYMNGEQRSRAQLFRANDIVS